MEVLRDAGHRRVAARRAARAARPGRREPATGRCSSGRTPEEIEALYRAREPYYAQAHLTVDTAGLGIDQVVARILAALRERHAERV